MSVVVRVCVGGEGGPGDSIRVGEIVAFKTVTQQLYVMHRVIKIHEKDDGTMKILTKGLV